MSARRSIIFFLLILVVASTGYLITRNDKSTAARATDKATQTPSIAPSRIIAYYFHVTVRCTTCRTIEAYSHETILNRFNGDIDSGRLEWQVVNIQLPENRHFVKDYQLFTKSVVLVRVANGKQQSYKVLNDVWELVGDKAQFQAYVDKEVRGYLAQL
ncbi:MAG: nitrophenyl compound nitroreductase subunit ArsF family protein [Acidobacteriota bacterium]|jgi:hypothetical protein|nr:nitrophenyl compound nitroreductase subunit ArsF family protein [Acidobacteriota bacterium]